MNKKRVLIIVLICVAAYAVFTGVIVLLFNYIRYNPIDAEAITYIRYYTEMEDQYGEILHIGKNVIRKTEKSDSLIRSPYSVETADKRIVVYVTLNKNGDEWKAVSYEVVEVKPIGY